MKDLILDRLNKISDLNERRILKNILYDIYENVVDYNLEMYEKLEKRIYDEIDDPLNDYYIYCSLDMVENINPISDFLHPMIPSDMDEVVFDMDEINEKIRGGEEIVLTSIFMKCQSIVLNEILKENKVFKGFVRTNKDIHEVSFYLRRCEKYIKEIEKLYRMFQTNGTAWNTVNCPYAYKFVDIILNSTLELRKEEKITEVTIDLAEYERYKVINAIPLWNIENIRSEDKSFPMPAKDRVNYDHIVSLANLGSQNGYMVGENNSEYMYCKRLNDDLIIISPIPEQHKWNLISIKNISNLRGKRFNFEILSNKRNLGFIGRYSSTRGMVVRTKGEIARLLKVYEQSKDLLFQNLEVRETYDMEPATSNYNFFIDDNTRLDTYKRVMILKFRPLDRENYLVYDKMSFLVSEIQILYPEYRCIGELV